MTKQELEQLIEQAVATPMVSISELPKGFEGTLLYGYTCERHTFHVYVKDEVIHAVTYNFDEEIIIHTSGKEVYAGSCFPDKRVYRQPTHFFFMELLAKKGFTPSVTESTLPEDFNISIGEFLERAKVVEDLKVIPSLA